MVHESITVRDEVSWTQTRVGEMDSIAILDDHDHIHLRIQGKSPTNEEDADRICERLVRALNAQGRAWEPPTRGTADVDGTSRDRVDPKKTLDIQVVRASMNRAMWRDLTETGEVKLDLHADGIADELLQAIDKKLRKYPVISQRALLTLALDANRLPTHTLQPVLESFRERHRASCAAMGFREIWLVGPRDELVLRLDA